MGIKMKFKAMQDASTADTQNIYDYILSLQHNNILSSWKEK